MDSTDEKCMNEQVEKIGHAGPDTPTSTRCRFRL